MLRVEMSREEVLAKVRAELSYAQPDDRLVRLRRLIMSIKSITEIVVSSPSRYPDCLVGLARELASGFATRAESVRVLRGVARPLWVAYILNISSVRRRNITPLLRQSFSESAIKEFHKAKSDWHTARWIEVSSQRRLRAMYRLAVTEDQQDFADAYQFIVAAQHKTSSYPMPGSWVNAVSPNDIAEILAWRLATANR